MPRVQKSISYACRNSCTVADQSSRRCCGAAFVLTVSGSKLFICSSVWILAPGDMVMLLLPIFSDLPSCFVQSSRAFSSRAAYNAQPVHVGKLPDNRPQKTTFTNNRDLLFLFFSTPALPIITFLLYIPRHQVPSTNYSCESRECRHTTLTRIRLTRAQVRPLFESSLTNFWRVARLATTTFTNGPIPTVYISNVVREAK